MNTNNIDNNRRDFLKKVGVGAAASAVVLSGCGSDKNPANGESITAQGEIPKDQMTYRINPKTGEQVEKLQGMARVYDYLGNSDNEAVLTEIENFIEGKIYTD